MQISTLLHSLHKDTYVRHHLTAWLPPIRTDQTGNMASFRGEGEWGEGLNTGVAKIQESVTEYMYTHNILILKSGKCIIFVHTYDLNAIAHRWRNFSQSWTLTRLNRRNVCSSLVSEGLVEKASFPPTCTRWWAALTSDWPRGTQMEPWSFAMRLSDKVHKNFVSMFKKMAATKWLQITNTHEI